MLELLKTQRLIDLKNQCNEVKEAAVKSMEQGDLKTYFDQITKADKLKREFSETLKLEV